MSSIAFRQQREREAARSTQVNQVKEARAALNIARNGIGNGNGNSNSMNRPVRATPINVNRNTNNTTTPSIQLPATNSTVLSRPNNYASPTQSVTTAAIARRASPMRTNTTTTTTATLVAPRSTSVAASVAPTVAASRASSLRTTAAPRSTLNSSNSAARLGASRRTHNTADDNDDDDGSDFPLPPTYYESKRIVAAENALRDARATRAIAAASGASTVAPTNNTTTTATRVPTTTTSSVLPFQPLSHTSSNSSLHSSVSSGAGASIISTSSASSSASSSPPTSAATSTTTPSTNNMISPNIRRRLSGTNANTISAAVPASAIPATSTSSSILSSSTSSSSSSSSSNSANNYSAGIALLERKYQETFGPQPTLMRPTISITNPSLNSSNRPVGLTPSAANAPLQTNNLRRSNDFSQAALSRNTALTDIGTAASTSSVTSYSSVPPASSGNEIDPAAVAAAAARRDRFIAATTADGIHPLSGLTNSSTSTSSTTNPQSRSNLPSAIDINANPSLYPYADRGSQLATLARQGRMNPTRINARNDSNISSSSSLSAANSALQLLDSDQLEMEPRVTPGAYITADEHLFAMQSYHQRMQSDLADLADTDDEDTATAAITALQNQRLYERERERMESTQTQTDPFRLTREDRAAAAAANSSSSSSSITSLSSAPPISSLHARVNRLQNQIDSELARASNRHRHRPQVRGRNRLTDLNDMEERKYGGYSSNDNEEEDDRDNHHHTRTHTGVTVDSDDEDDGLDIDDTPSSSVTWNSNPSVNRGAPRSNPMPPPRSNTRVIINFSPYISVAERSGGYATSTGPNPNGTSSSSTAAQALADSRTRAEQLAARANGSSSSSNNNNSSSSSSSSSSSASVQVGSLSVRMDRAAALRQEMAFLSSLFDNVRNYQTNLVQSLNRAGFVDDSQMAALPGLHVGLIHFLIESAWAAAARSAGLSEEQMNFDPNAGPTLPPGHEQRVENLSSITLTVAATDDCCICLDSMGIGSSVIDLHECKHRFHSTCIKQWLGKSNSCPLCKRTAIPVPNNDNSSSNGINASNSPIMA